MQPARQLLWMNAEAFTFLFFLHFTLCSVLDCFVHAQMVECSSIQMLDCSNAQMHKWSKANCSKNIGILPFVLYCGLGATTTTYVVVLWSDFWLPRLHFHSAENPLLVGGAVSTGGIKGYERMWNKMMSPDGQ